MRTKYRTDTFKCPRCGNKCIDTQKKCDECGLVFARLNEATNAEAKKQFFARDKSIVMTTTLPKDVNKIVLALLCAFLGPFGAHALYVGRYYRGFYMLLWGLLVLVYVSFPYPQDWMVQVMSSFPIVLFVGITTLFWFTDFILIVFGKFKVPVALGRKA